jgi:hypothetical protein
LDKQVEEKKQQRDLERKKECRLDEALLRSSKLAIMLAKEEDEVRSVYFFLHENFQNVRDLLFIAYRLLQGRRKLNKDIDAFRQTYQKPQCRRDFDLYDPELGKKTKPLRETDEDGLGPASAQKYDFIFKSVTDLLLTLL